MQIGAEYLTSNTRIAYPFKDNATGLDYEGAGAYTPVPRIPVAAFVDAIFTSPSSPTLYLRSIYRVDSISYELVFRDGNGVDETASFILSPGGTGFVQYLLTPAVAPETDIRTVRVYGKMLVSAAEFEAYMLGLSIGQTISFGDTLPLAQRAVVVRPQRLLSLIGYDRHETVPSDDARDTGALDGHVKLLAGYNIQLEATEVDDASDTVGLTITANAGLGLGRVPCGDGSGSEAAAPQVGQQLHPDALGNVRITGDQCYAVVPHPTTGEIEIQGNCVACCDCDDFVTIGEELRELLARTKELYDNLTAIHLGPLPGSTSIPPGSQWGYEEAVTWWNEHAGQHGSGSVDISGYGLKAYLGAKDYGSLTLFARNFMPYRIEIKFTVICDAECTRPLKGWRVSHRETSNVAWPAVDVTDVLNPGVSVRYLWELHKEGGVPPATALVSFRKYGTSDPYVQVQPYPLSIDMV
jgi:hypothetical protein